MLTATLSAFAFRVPAHTDDVERMLPELIVVNWAMAVDRCICRNITFSQALLSARAIGAHTVGALQRFVPIGSGCGLCIPYMQLALASGVTTLAVLTESEADRLMECSGVRLLGEEE